MKRFRWINKIIVVMVIALLIFGGKVWGQLTKAEDERLHYLFNLDENEMLLN